MVLKLDKLKILNEKSPLTIKLVIGAIGLITTIVTTAVTIDSRYAHSEDYENFKKEINQNDVNRWTTFQRQQLEDKLFEYDAKSQFVKGGLTSYDKLMLSRYKQQLNDLKSQQNSQIVK